MAHAGRELTLEGDLETVQRARDLLARLGDGPDDRVLAIVLRSVIAGEPRAIPSGRLVAYDAYTFTEHAPDGLDGEILD